MSKVYAPKRNVCLRFFLGPTNPAVLKSQNEVFKHHAVVVDYEGNCCDVYGRPDDVANAITKTFLITEARKPPSDTTSCHDADLEPTETISSSNSSNLDLDSSSLSNSTSTQNLVMSSHEDAQSSTTEKILDNIISHTRNTRLESATADATYKDKVDTTKELRNEISDDAVKTMLKRIHWKTDYDLMLERYTPAIGAEPTVIEPGSMTIILSMPVWMAHYLAHISGGYRSFLARKQDLKACARKGLTPEELGDKAKEAGLFVAMSKNPLLGSNEVATWVQVENIKSMRLILNGVAKSLASEPLFSKMQSNMSKERWEKQLEWDKILQHFRSAGKDADDDDEWVTCAEGLQPR
ncbi:hypothetical protein BGZ51_000630 [Haplosporangium sp. Z 767]|nr:hypothetical protein BGZ51_000630 [Haplosporangium sp. Z 767]KAF9192992.1 hypothetical protein BGZ50_007986 [Haplosporangium sp. Z 11]